MIFYFQCLKKTLYHVQFWQYFLLYRFYHDIYTLKIQRCNAVFLLTT